MITIDDYESGKRERVLGSSAGVSAPAGSPWTVTNQGGLPIKVYDGAKTYEVPAGTTLVVDRNGNAVTKK